MNTAREAGVGEVGRRRRPARAHGLLPSILEPPSSAANSEAVSRVNSSWPVVATMYWDRTEPARRRHHRRADGFTSLLLTHLCHVVEQVGEHVAVRVHLGREERRDDA